MKLSKGIVISIAAATIGLIVTGLLISANNYGVRTENALRAKIENNENIYAQGTQRVMEIAQLPAMYRDDLQKVFTAAIQGRYGENGSQATFQWLKEQNPQLNDSLYQNVARQVEAFRREFQNNQTELLQMRATYENALGQFPGAVFLSLTGFPKLDMSKITIVTTDTARETFETKRDKGLQLR